jgi:hypothetical protein
MEEKAIPLRLQPVAIPPAQGHRTGLSSQDLFRLRPAAKQLEESLVPVPFHCPIEILFCARCGALFKLMGGRYTP